MRFSLFLSALALPVLLLAAAGGASAQSYQSGSGVWGSSLGFQSPNERAARIAQEDLRLRHDGGYYDQWTTHITQNTYQAFCGATATGISNSNQNSGSFGDGGSVSPSLDGTAGDQTATSNSTCSAGPGR